MGKNRRNEYAREETRKEILANFNMHMEANSSTLLAKMVDEEAVIKGRVNMYAQWRHAVQDGLRHSPDVENYERHRNAYSSGYHTAEVPLHESIEAMFWEEFNEGFDGSDYPTRQGEFYVCRNPNCRQKYMVIPELLPMECKRCGEPTPLGMLVACGRIKR